jgi:hypothetical protein
MQRYGWLPAKVIYGHKAARQHYKTRGAGAAQLDFTAKALALLA